MKALLRYIGVPLLYIATATNLLGQDSLNVKFVEEYLKQNGVAEEYFDGSVNAEARSVLITIPYKKSSPPHTEGTLELRLSRTVINGRLFLFATCSESEMCHVADGDKTYEAINLLHVAWNSNSGLDDRVDYATGYERGGKDEVVIDLNEIQLQQQVQNVSDLVMNLAKQVLIKKGIQH